MQLLVKGTRRIIFILCAVSDAKRLSISKHPANAHNINNLSPLAVQDDYTSGALAWEANRLFYSNPCK